MASEVRAWISVGVVLFAQLAGTIWWAATLSARIEALQAAIADLRERRELGPLTSQIADHEARLRALEQQRAR